MKYVFFASLYEKMAYSFQKFEYPLLMLFEKIKFLRKFLNIECSFLDEYSKELRFPKVCAKYSKAVLT